MTHVSARIGLNAIRVFESAARHLSLKLAAGELCVTPSAVSHQIKALEAEIGVALFHRRNNGIVLTDAGAQYFGDVAPGLAIIEKATEALRGSAYDVVIRVPVVLAMRWLIPVLDEFKHRHPNTRIRIETTHYHDFPVTPTVDLAITYRRLGTKPGRGRLLMADARRPVAAPSLLARLGGSDLRDTACRLPAICPTDGDRDWGLWAAEARLKPADLIPGDVFDTDDAAIYAAIAGMGMVLAPEFSTQREVKANLLVALPDAPAVKLGYYDIVSTPKPRSIVGQLQQWLCHRAADTGRDA